ncbi:hypothetical protein [Agrobacterium sp.]|uniref:hypothetical protein n=1 Tax=Agrobacterium sp. TaxID=361 RepID=UPI0028A65BE6|nr:hypothetical protein [Agrobacterium sp.]
MFFQKSNLTLPALSPYLFAPAAMLIGIYLLVRCIILLRRVIFPRLRVRFPASAEPFTLTIPKSGRYVINVLIPPMTFFMGTSHFSARFTLATSPEGQSINYRSYRRGFFQVKRTDMSGKQAMPLGSFECATPGEISISCDNPETIRSNYQLEVSRHIPPLRLVSLVVATIASSTLAIGGFAITILWMTGRI